MTIRLNGDAHELASRHYAFEGRCFVVVAATFLEPADIPDSFALRDAMWGDELFGIDNALVGYWPVVMIQNGKARIQEFSSILDWWEKR